MVPERKAQLKAMEAEVEKLRAASGIGDMAGIMRWYGALRNQLDAYLTGLETNKDGGKVFSEPMGT